MLTKYATNTLTNTATCSAIEKNVDFHIVARFEKIKKKNFDV